MRPDTSHNYLPETLVHHWREVKDVTLVDPGWYCHVYPKNDEEFTSWMEVNCPQSSLTWRFNNGSPYYSVYIPCESEASMFALKWI